MRPFGSKPCRPSWPRRRMKNSSGDTSTKPSPSTPTRWKPNAKRSSMTSTGTSMSHPRRSGERDALRATLQAREAEVSELAGRSGSRTRGARRRHRSRTNRLWPSFAREFDRERETLVTGRAERATFAAASDREREALAAAVERHGEELEQLRQQLAEQSKAHELELSQLRLGFAGERHDLAARLKVSGDELAALRVVSERERDALIAKVSALEAKRAELRSAFDRIADLKNQTNEPADDAGRSMSEAIQQARSNSGAAGRPKSCRRRSRRGGAEGHAAPGALPVRISRP